MNVKLGIVPGFFLFLVVVLSVFAKTVLSLDQKCPPLKLVSGRSRYRWRGRSVRFNCMTGFQLVGVKYATCMNGKWDANVPICVKYGCRAPSTTHVNGQFIESYRGAVVKIVCNPGYTLMGSSSVYCNGVRWNETFPVCRVTNLTPALSCDFEDANLCGWNQDPMHDFDWKRQNGTSGLGEAASGPTSDHTQPENSTGYYMYMENSNSRVKDGAARLYSPVYPSGYSNGTCFKFWYNLHGSSSGYLKVYVKPEGVELSNLIPSFWINGDQGLSWLPGFFQIQPTDSPFQIVIEGIRGPESVSDTAFDDVQLISGEECIVLENMTSPTEPATSTAVPGDEEGYSCKNRCNGGENDDEAPLCDCRETCLRDDNCCPDYYFYCQASVAVSTTTQSEPETSTTSLILKSTTAISNFVNITIIQPPVATDYNNQSNEIDPGNPIVHQPPKDPLNRAINQIPKIEKTTTQKPKKEMKNTTEIGGKNETRVPKIPTVVVNRNRWKVPTNKTGLPEVPEKAIIVNVTSSTTTPAPRRPPKPQKPNNIKLTYAEKPSSPVLSNESRFPNGKQKEPSEKEHPQAIKIDKNEENSTGTFRGIIEVGGTSLALLVIVVLGVLWYWRSRQRKTERDHMVEDSDSIVYQMDSSNLSSENHSLVCIRPGGLQQ